MNTEKYNEPAFAVSGQVRRTDVHGEAYRPVFYEGLSKREYFAALAMQGLLAQLATSSVEIAKLQREYWMKAYGGDIKEAQAIAKEAVMVADYLIAELSNTKS